MNKIKKDNINIGIFILSFFVYLSFLDKTLSYFEMGKEIGDSFIFTYSLLFILIYILTKFLIRKDDDKRKLY